MPEKAWFEQVMQDLEDAYLFISRGGVIQDVAGAVNDIFKVPSEELLGATVSDLEILRADFLRNYTSASNKKFLPSGGKNGIYLDRQHRLRWKYYEAKEGNVVAKVSRMNANLEAEEAIVDQLADALPMMVTYVDRNWRFLFNNKAYEDFIGLTREELYRKPVSSVMTEESFKRVVPRFERALKGERVNYEDRLTLADGRSLHFNVSYIPDFLGDEVGGFYAVINDVSEYSAMINLLKDIHAAVNRTDVGTQEIIRNLLCDALDYLGQDIAIVSQVTGDQYTIMWCESREEGLEPGAVLPLGDTYCRLTLNHDDVFHTIDAGNDIRFSGHPCYETFGLETYVGAPIRVNGSVWGTVNFSSAESRVKPFSDIEVELVRLIVGAVERIVTHSEYLSQVRRERDEMAAQARKDQLTGLPNRAYLNDYVNTLVNSPDVQRGGICLAVIDIDHFKTINDTYGHHIGDQVIVWLSELFIDILRARAGDFAARVGGEEFVVMINNSSLDVARSVMERVRSKVESMPVPIEGVPTLFITISSGVTQWQSTDTYPNVFKRADEALYRAKHGGRNQVCVNVP
ncbi:PAS domain S-box-containing protein/diguanylate cyclase (GGDEF)-like protein [Chromohalobacter marismortui]|uniref:diguanylate cyclase n=1 Tax=Chromohalobacter marismortui TaxID=42055 RepID=A0A4R7NRR2_9GAMM|nr:MULTISPECIES: diguanylate cyclase [Chromohalobacter]MCI0592390.1 diguanylate cyclase [Chromohalobacter sp.]TDU23567.1 PAS domain S-box-containing protein/diguanylate cyclase (GGDEF)-like protein [Chromohalobacter marismortui]